MSGHQAKPETCDNCGWDTPELTEHDAFARSGHGPFTPDEEKEWAWLCIVCRSTQAGNMYLYPRQYPDGLCDLGATVCWGINAVLDELRALAEEA